MQTVFGREAMLISKPTRRRTFGCSATSAFFLPQSSGQIRTEMEATPNKMSTNTMAERVAAAVRHFQHERTGHAPESVTVVFSEGTLVITLHGALTTAEMAMSQTPEGVAQVREFHRELFQNSLGPLRDEIWRITGVAVREAMAEIEPSSGALVQVFSTGTMVQRFRLADGLSVEAWNANRDDVCGGTEIDVNDFKSNGPRKRNRK